MRRVITRLTIKNFQSLRSIDLELGGFTVIVGASNAGKSALTRAIRALTSNVNSSSAVTAGKSAFTISAALDDGTSVSLERGPGKSEYRISDGNTERVFTKSGRGVPAEVTEILPTSEINFAGQFDRPFLLDATSTDVARILGALTNIDKVLAALREANRRAVTAGAELRTRERDLEQTLEELQTFRGLNARREAATAADELVSRAEATQTKLATLSRLRATLETCQTARSTALRTLEASAIPDTSLAEATATRLSALRRTTSTLTAAATARAKAKALVDREAQAAEKAETELHAALQAAGTCPLCGADTSQGAQLARA
jgi:DNA repair exonuclease SbcCD ATPase subunit